MQLLVLPGHGAPTLPPGTWVLTVRRCDTATWRAGAVKRPGASVRSDNASMLMLTYMFAVRSLCTCTCTCTVLPIPRARSPALLRAVAWRAVRLRRQMQHPMKPQTSKSTTATAAMPPAIAVIAVTSEEESSTS